MMLYYRCKCGKSSSVGSYPPDACVCCPSCGSDLALHPDAHREPKPHEFTLVRTIETDQGSATITYCCHCHRTRREIEREAKVDAADLATTLEDGPKSTPQD